MVSNTSNTTTDKSRQVTVIGDAAVDAIIQLPKSQEQTTSFNIIQPILSPGGTAGNTSLSLARLGYDVTMFFAIGSDSYGKYLLRALEDANVSTEHVHVSQDHFTLHVNVIIDHLGERHFAGNPYGNWASVHYPPDKVSHEAIAKSSWLHTTGNSFDRGTTPQSTIRSMTIAKQHKIPISLDLNLRSPNNQLSQRYRQAISKAIDLADYVLGSADDEIALYTQIDDHKSAALALSAGKRTVISRLGKHGCLVVTPAGDITAIPAYKVNVVDTLGAGDTYNAGFISAHLEGATTLEAARTGNAIAALCVSNEGVTENITIDSLHTLMHSQARVSK
jgi:fructokinase